MASRTITETIGTVPHEPTLQMRLGQSHQPVKSKNNNNGGRLKTLKLDPSRALEPAKKKLNTIESQRIMAVFEDTIKKAEIVTAIPFIMSNLERFRVSLGSELFEVIKKHQMIQENYKGIRSSLDELLERRSEVATLKALAAEKDELQNTEFHDSNIVNEDSECDFDDEKSEEGGGDQDDKEHTEEGDIKESDSDKKNVGRTAANVEKMSVNSVEDFLEPRIEETMRSLGLVAQQVSHSCKNILRLFTVNPSAMKLLSNDEKLRTEGGQNAVNSLNELRDILMHKLLTTPQEEVERISYLDEISKRERYNAAIIEKQEEELKVAIDDKEEEIRKKNDIIKRLQTDLHQIEKFSDENIRRMRAEAEKQEISDSKSSDQKTQKLQGEINQLQTQLNNSIAEHRDLEADLRAKKYKVENEVDNWIQKYDQDLGERQDEYEEIDLVYTEEKKQLLELEERFATLEKEYMTIMEERRISRDKRERAQRELALLVKSATTIQAFWRSYKVRKALKTKNKKKGKGKK